MIENKPNKFEGIENYLSRFDGERPGVFAMAIKDHKVVYSKGVGLANLEYNMPITSNTVFNLASIAKTMTAMGIIFLKERNKLDYDDEIIKYFPELSHYCKGVKIRHLLNQESGIIDYFSVLEKKDISDIHFTNEKCYKLLTKEEKLIFKPGSQFDYSNSNYVLLSMLIEKVTNKSLGNFLKENIFNPLGMNSAVIFNEDQPIVKNRSYGYGMKDNKWHCDYIGSLTTGDGCLFASGEDLLSFEKAIYTEKIISKKSLEEAFTPSIVSDYGFGWRTKHNTSDKKWVYHTGDDRGARCIFLTIPNHKLTVILLANFNEFSTGDMQYIIDYFMDMYIQK